MDEANYRWKYYNRNTLRIIMKKIHLLTACMMLISGLTSCQTIANLDTAYPVDTPNTYYKDIENKLNPFEGTWIYDDGISYIKIVLVKKLKIPTWQYFEDYLIGGYQYKKNGVEIINTLSDINSYQNDPINYPISGNRFRYRQNGPFSSYTSNPARLFSRIIENGCISHMNIRTLILNGQLAIQIDKGKPFEISQDCNPVIPNGFYYLIKQ